MAFEDDEGMLKVWFGRIQKMLLSRTSKAGKRTSSKVVLQSVPVDDISDGLSVRCRFYSKLPSRRSHVHKFKYGVSSSVGPDSRSYPSSSILHVVEFKCDSDTDDVYTLDRDQWTKVQNKLRNLKNSTN